MQYHCPNSTLSRSACHDCPSTYISRGNAACREPCVMEPP